MLVAYETQKHVPKYDKYNKYHESAVINLTTILAVLLSSICQVVVIIFHLNDQRAGVLLVITLRDCLWMFPIIYLLFIPKVCAVVMYMCRGSSCLMVLNQAHTHGYPFKLKGSVSNTKCKTALRL